MCWWVTRCCLNTIFRHFPTLHGPNVERKNLNFILGKDYIGFSSSIKDRIWSR